MPGQSDGSSRWARRASALALSAAALLSGCATVDPVDPYAVEPIARHLERDDDVGYCARLYADIDRRVDAIAVRDAEAPRIAGFPYLRVDRLTAALAPRAAADSPPRKAWLARLAALDDAGRTAELANAMLPPDDLARCRVLLGAADAASFDTLKARAQVPDAYSAGARAIGLYPLTQLLVAANEARWQEEMRAVFALPLDQLPVQGRLTRFGVRTASPVPEIVFPVPADPLGLPVPSRLDRNMLLVRHAPLLEIDVRAGYDRPGELGLDGADLPVLDPDQPIAYTRLTHALFEDGARIQLVYTFWFSERPARDVLDPLSGRIDGLVWRVTLDKDGSPLVYDAMRPSGRHHVFFPTERVVARPQQDALDERMFSPQAVRAPKRDEVVVLRVESGTHYLQRVSVEPRAQPAVRYQLDDDRRPTTLPSAAGGTRSVFGGDGLMPGTERGERHFLWPTGVASPGQMRQWGHHATAFVGRRHFDDPRLLGSYFELRPAASAARAP
jgi:hypothetical protein